MLLYIIVIRLIQIAKRLKAKKININNIYKNNRYLYLNIITRKFSVASYNALNASTWIRNRLVQLQLSMVSQTTRTNGAQGKILLVDAQRYLILRRAPPDQISTNAQFKIDSSYGQLSSGKFGALGGGGSFAHARLRGRYSLGLQQRSDPFSSHMSSSPCSLYRALPQVKGLFSQQLIIKARNRNLKIQRIYRGF